MNALRLANAALATRQADPDGFSMARFINFCGSPACVLGNYAARQDLQDEFRLTDFRMVPRSGGGIFCDDQQIMDHFDITEQECVELFDEDGCGGATTPEAAALYIEAFIERKLRAEPLPDFVRALFEPVPVDA